jgi:hypothetical protein
MPTARLQARFDQANIDKDSGVISGVKVMELGHTATFEGKDGNPVSVKITPQHISALLSHAGNRAIPCHWSHDWFEGKADPIHARVGALKSLRKDAAGNLIGDLNLAPGEHRDTALWNAENAPDQMMLSAVFDYHKKDPQCMPINFRAADLVSQGAGVTALFSEANPNTTMDINEFLTLLKDPQTLAALKSIIKSVEDGQDDDAAAAEMEKDAGVTDADKKKEDDQKPALMRSVARLARVISRQAKSIEDNKTALLAEVKTQSEAAATALLGNGNYIRKGVDGADTFTAKLAEYRKLAPNDVIAGQRLLKDHPEMTPQWEAHQRERCANLASK